MFIISSLFLVLCIRPEIHNKTNTSIAGLAAFFLRFTLRARESSEIALKSNLMPWQLSLEASGKPLTGREVLDIQL